MRQADIDRLERAGDVRGLIAKLREKRRRIEGGRTTGQAARDLMKNLGLDLPEDGKAEVVNLAEVRVVDAAWETRVAAARALGRLSKLEGHLALAETLYDDDPRVVQAALDALRGLGGAVRTTLIGFEDTSGFAQMSAVQDVRTALREQASDRS